VQNFIKLVLLKFSVQGNEDIIQVILFLIINILVIMFQMGLKENGCGIRNGGWRGANHIRSIQYFIYRVLMENFSPYAI